MIFAKLLAVTQGSSIPVRDTLCFLLGVQKQWPSHKRILL